MLLKSRAVNPPLPLGEGLIGGVFEIAGAQSLLPFGEGLIGGALEVARGQSPLPLGEG